LAPNARPQDRVPETRAPADFISSNNNSKNENNTNSNTTNNSNSNNITDMTMKLRNMLVAFHTDSYSRGPNPRPTRRSMELAFSRKNSKYRDGVR